MLGMVISFVKRDDHVQPKFVLFCFRFMKMTFSPTPFHTSKKHVVHKLASTQLGCSCDVFTLEGDMLQI